MALKAVALNCTLKSSSAKDVSSTEKLLKQILAAFGRYDVAGEMIRIADHDVKAGVTSDEGNGDAWPAIRKRILDSNILLIGTPIWLGQPSSLCKRVLERMDAFLGETDDAGRMASYGRVAALAVVGNEDGAHHVTAEVYQALNDVGFTLPASAVAYWVGEAMGKVNYADLPKTPDKVQQSIDNLTRNAAHLAGWLSQNQYPGTKS
jgi:multimeric flavodoxin WrbA